MNVQAQLSQMNKQEYETMLRQNVEYRSIINLFNEFNKPIYHYKPLNGIDNLKLVN
jgi:hypothetical protein